MKLSRVPLVLMLCTILAACGFTESFSPETRARLAAVHVLPIAEREGQLFNTALRQALNPTHLQVATAHNLEVQLTTSVSKSFTDADGSARARGTLRAASTLRDLNGAVVWQATRTQSDLFTVHELPSLTEQAQARLWERLAEGLAQTLAVEMAHVLKP